MKLLLDTHLLIWAGNEPEKITAETRGLLADVENELYFSTISIWEVAIKQTHRNSSFYVDARFLRRALLANGYLELTITSDHAVTVSSLPVIHKDPFDRMLIAQSMVEGMPLLTTDAIVAQYLGLVRKV
jgi:PIN domain nuclease of toxin-antitoxin system